MSRLCIPTDATTRRVHSYPAHDFRLAASMGQIDGAYAVHKFGSNTAVGTTETILASGVGVVAGFKPFPLTTEYGQLHAVSDSANDTAGGTGARAIAVTGINSSWERVATPEVLTMNGLGSSTLSTSTFARCPRAWVTEAGSLGTNDGNITIYAGAVPIAHIVAGNGQTTQCFDSIPKGHTAYVTRYTMYIDSSKTAEFGKMWSLRGADTDLPVKRLIAEAFGILQSETAAPSFPSPIAGPTDLYISSKMGVGTAPMSATFDMLVVPD